MKLILLCIAAGFTAFGLGLETFYSSEFLVSIFQKQDIERVELKETEKIEPAQIPVEELVYPKESLTKQTGEDDLKSENENRQFDPTGDYYIIGGAEKNFDDFDYLTIETMDYQNASKENNWEATPIPPKGYLEKASSKRLKLAGIFISDKQISFETETKNGISYKFVGKFIEPKEVKSAEDSAESVLQGVLFKFKNGRTIISRRVNFAYIQGC